MRESGSARLEGRNKGEIECSGSAHMRIRSAAGNNLEPWTKFSFSSLRCALALGAGAGSSCFLRRAPPRVALSPCHSPAAVLIFWIFLSFFKPACRLATNAQSSCQPSSPAASMSHTLVMIQREMRDERPLARSLNPCKRAQYDFFAPPGRFLLSCFFFNFYHNFLENVLYCIFKNVLMARFREN